MPGLLAEGKLDRTLRVIAKANRLCPSQRATSWAAEVETLAEIGRCDDALALAKELQALPALADASARHGGHGSVTSEGRQRRSRNWRSARADTAPMPETPFATTKTAQGIRRRSPYLGPDSQTLDPKTDVVFKLLFAAERNRPLLIKLLSAVLKPASPIAEVRVLNPELEPSEYGDKRAVLDILAGFEDGSRVDIEMQARPHEAIEERLVFYWAKTYTRQLGAGDPHTRLAPVIGIYFLAFMRLPSSRAHCTFHINEDQEGFPLTDALELHFLELPKYATLKARGGLPERVDGDSTDELVYWCKFLAAETEAEQESVAMANSNIQEAKTRLDELSADPKARKLAEDRVLWEWAYHQDIDGAERRGREEGREEGLRDGREEGLRDGRDEGMREGLLEAIASLCEVLGIELTEEHAAEIHSATIPELQSALAALKRDRVWPG